MIVVGVTTWNFSCFGIDSGIVCRVGRYMPEECGRESFGSGLRQSDGGKSDEAYVRASRGNGDGGEVVVVSCGAEGFIPAVRGYFGSISEVCVAWLIVDRG